MQYDNLHIAPSNNVAMGYNIIILLLYIYIYIYNYTPSQEIIILVLATPSNYQKFDVELHMQLHNGMVHCAVCHVQHRLCNSYFNIHVLVNLSQC